MYNRKGVGSTFHIVDIINGWFIFTLHADHDAFSIDCSKYAGIDVGKQFIDIANSLIKNQFMQRYICLNSEQYAYRLELQRNDKSVKISSCEIAGHKDASMVAFHFINATPSAIAFASVKPPAFVAEYDVFDLASSIYLAFRDIDKEKYQQNWFPFPQSEYDQLHEYMKHRIYQG